jgi:hypothetical protein
MKIGNGRLVLLFVLACGTIHAGNVVTDWNTIALTTLVTNGGKSPAASGVWFAYTSIAVYDAVNAITGQSQPFYDRIAAPANASTGAAAVAAVGEAAAKAIISARMGDGLEANIPYTPGSGLTTVFRVQF